MAGRKPYPVAFMKETNDKQRLTKAAIKDREKNEPKTDQVRLICPQHMSDVAKKEWKKLVKIYKSFETPILNDLDKRALEVYCESVSLYINAMSYINEQGFELVEDNFKTGTKVNPYITVAKQAADQMKKYGEILLLDPVSRARASLSTNKKPEDMTPIEAFRARRAQGG